MKKLVVMLMCFVLLPVCPVCADTLQDKIAGTISERTYEEITLNDVFKDGEKYKDDKNSNRVKGGAENFREQRTAAKAGDARAQASFGLFYLIMSLYDEETAEGAVKEMQDKAKSEDKQTREAARKWLNYYGNYLKLSPKQRQTESLKWLRKAADQNHVFALFTLGLMHYVGMGVKENKAQAFKYFKRAADAGNPQAQYMIGAMYHLGETVKASDSEALKWWRKSAAQDYPAAQCRLGTMYYFGKSVKRSIPEALKWWEKAANNNYPAAQCRLGTLYYLGIGVLKDKAEALKLWSKSAEQKDPQAQFCMGAMYYLGDGVEQNYSEAANWWSKSAERGYDDAKEELAKLTQEVNHE